jgi:DNA-binding transcriptional LysR family regulator
VVPERMAENRTGIFVCDTPVPVQGFTKSMAWHGRTHRNPAQVWLRELLLETSRRRNPSTPPHGNPGHPYA